MPVQNNAGMQIIRETNACFGTMRFVNGASASNYRYNLSLQPGQLPSVYYANDPNVSNDTLRLRPLHQNGFAVGAAGTRLYFAIAGLPMVNPRNALSTNLNQVTGEIYESQYYVFVKLGVDKTHIRNALTDLITNAEQITTQQLRTANGNQNVNGNTRVARITDGELAGTFWGYRSGGWGAGPSAYDGKYLPMNLLDFAVGGGQINQAQGTGGNYANSLNVVPQNVNQVHTGHSMIYVNQLRDYYYDQNNPGGAGSNVTGQQVWDNFSLLGQYRQYTGLVSNGTGLVTTEILPLRRFYPTDMFNYFPTYDPFNAVPLVAKQASQRLVTCEMIGAFVNN